MNEGVRPRDSFRVNNFDLVRLLAALQVAYSHSSEHLRIHTNESAWTAIATFFPGVPTFFFVSGFLISRSYENNPRLGEYARNRVLRIYPALITCTFLAGLSVLVSGYFEGTDVNAWSAAMWLVGQVSVVQFYNPSFMRGFGTGVLNGSLWTITVELQFYVLVPLLYWLLGKVGDTRKKTNLSLLSLTLLFLCAHLLAGPLRQGQGEHLLVKLYKVSFVPWFYMFLVGVLYQRNFHRVLPALRNRFHLVLPVFLATSYVTTRVLSWRGGNNLNPVNFVLLTLVIFSFAYSFQSLAVKILRRNDISYGVYIYHIPVVNLFIYFGYVSKPHYVVLALAVVVLLAIASWVLIERPAISLKRHPLMSLGCSRETTKRI
jgi:peptidoglycan/LPS O-acetylase OafA/YrhL